MTNNIQNLERNAFIGQLKKIDPSKFEKAANDFADTLNRSDSKTRQIDVLRMIFLAVHKEYVKSPEQLAAIAVQEKQELREARIRELGEAALAKEEAAKTSTK